MRRTIIVFVMLCLCLTPAVTRAVTDVKKPQVLVLCWHAVRLSVADGDRYSVSQATFVEQLEYLRTHGYQPVSVGQILQAVNGTAILPEKAVLLSFDDAYRSYYDFVLPVLTRFGYPSMLAVVGAWIEEGPPEGLPEPLMTWDEIAAVSASDLVEVVSHSYNLHRSVRYNRPGNVGAVVSVRQYLPAENRYESETEYREKLARDFARQADLFQRYLGISPMATVWPYGRTNDIATALARASGSPLAFNLNGGLADLNEPLQLNRILVENRPIQDFINLVEHPNPPPDPIRAVQVDLDLIYDPASYEQTDRNLGLLIERLVAIGANTVFLQAFHDAAGTGDVGRVYFYNRVLPVEADIFSHAVHQLIIRDFMVYAWMPTISIVLPDNEINQRYRVREFVDGEVRPSTSWYHRLTPFSEEIRGRVRMLYEDLAFGSQIHGILFQDDAYLTDHEDVHPLAIKRLEKEVGRSISMDGLTTDRELQERWTTLKTDTLIAFIDELKAGVRRFRPQARFARNMYANVLINPRSKTWFAQDYDKFLNRYDQVVVMAYPQMENARRPVKWLKQLAAKAAAAPLFSDKTIFKLQAYDWEAKDWIDQRRLLTEMRTVLAAGVRHLAYYPDNLWHDRPNRDTIMLEMSTRTSPRAD